MAFIGLFVGVDRYSSPGIGWLNCAKRDAVALDALFRDNLGGETTLLTDNDATRSNIKDAFSQLHKCEIDDTVVISFSGHGSETHELITHDADPSNLGETAIPLDELGEWFTKIPSKHLVIFLDCCFSGGLGAKVLKVDALPRKMKSVDARLNEMAGDGRIILTASSPTEPAWETQKYGHGLFTHSLIEALQGPEEIVEKKSLSVYRLIEYVTQRVISAASQFGEVQNPTMRGSIDGSLRWPVFEPGEQYKALFKKYDSIRVTENIRDLTSVGVPKGTVDALADVIPTLNELQVDAINDFGVLRGEHLVVSAPTSSGKTMIGELAALRAIGNRQKAIFLFPLKALVADKLQYFLSTYGPAEMRTIEATGETDDLSDLLRGRYDIALLTYEKFASIILSFPHVLEQAGVVIVDESQTLADNSRGANLEFLLTLIRMKRREGVEPQLISLSAVIGDMGGFEQWLGARILRRTSRPVPLDEGLILGDGSQRYIDGESFEEKLIERVIQPIYTGKNSSQDLIIPLAKKLVSEGKQVIVFRETKGETRGCARYLANSLGLPPAQRALDELPTGDRSQASDQLREALRGGVCFHNADLDRNERLVIEECFREQESSIRVIVATTTLAMGVNTPASAVIVAGLTHPVDVPYSVAEYKNLVGRAGRLGFSEKGTSYLIASTGSDEHSYWERYVLGTPEDLESRFLDPRTDPRSLIVKVIAASKSIAAPGMTIDEVASFLEASFGCYQMEHSNPGWNWDRSELERAFSDLIGEGLIESDEGERYKLTKLGMVAGEAGIEVASVVRLVACLRRVAPEDITDPTLLTAVQLTRELNELHFPINKRSKHKEPQKWIGELRNQGVAREVISSLTREIAEEYEEALRAKKAVACLLYVSGREMNELEEIITQHGGRFNGAAGPIRGISARTCDMLAPAARVAELLHPEIDLHDRVERLAIRLTYGVASEATDLARQAGNSLNRGDYARLVEAGIDDLSSINEAGDDQILACVDSDTSRLNSVRKAAEAMKKFEEDKGSAKSIFLEPYKA